LPLYFQFIAILFRLESLKLESKTDIFSKMAANNKDGGHDKPNKYNASKYKMLLQNRSQTTKYDDQDTDWLTKILPTLRDHYLNESNVTSKSSISQHLDQSTKQNDATRPHKRAIFIDSLSLSCPQPSKTAAQLSAKNSTTKRKILFNHLPNKAHQIESNDPTTSQLARKQTVNYVVQRNGHDDDFDDYASDDNIVSLSLRDNMANGSDQPTADNNETVELVKPVPFAKRHTITYLFCFQKVSKHQILSRLVQIREYLKQAYSTLTSLQTTEDLVRFRFYLGASPGNVHN
jgi:hypothetical protein